MNYRKVISDISFYDTLKIISQIKVTGCENIVD